MDSAMEISLVVEMVGEVTALVAAGGVMLPSLPLKRVEGRCLFRVVG